MNKQSSGLFPILMVEDSREDFVATERALRKAGMANPIFHCEDGDEALDYLYRKGDYSDPKTSPRPSIILLDLNMPGTDGREVLGELKSDEDLKDIPVIVLTTSTDERDIEECYRIGASSYVPKPVKMDGFMDAIERMADFMFEIAILPRNKE